MSDGSEAPAGLPLRSVTLYLVAATAVLAPLDVVLVGPALPAIASAFDVGSARAGLVITAYAAPGVVAAPLVGLLADRAGRRRVLVPCLVLFGVAGVGVGLVSDFRLVLALRFVQGCVGGSILASLALTLAGDFYEGPRRNAVVGFVSAAVTVSAAVLPAVGGALAARSWRAVFYVYALSAVVGVAVYLGLPEPRLGDREGSTSAGGSYLRDALDAIPLDRALGLYGAGLVGYTLFFGALLTAVPFLLSTSYGLGSGRIGALLTAVSLLGAAVALGNGRLTRYRSSTELLVLGLGCYGCGLAATWLVGSTAGLVAALGLFGIGHGLAQPSLAAALGGLGPGRFRGGVMSLRTSVVLAAQAVGPPLFTAPAAALGYRPLLLAGGVGGLVAAAVGAVALARD
ncbi:MAG: MFS transporter [Haloferacaceae archaeon]